MKKFYLLWFALSSLWIGAEAQTPLKSIVKDGQSGQTITGVVVKVYGPENKVLTVDREGMVDLSSLPNGSYTVMISAPGYEARQWQVLRDGVTLLPSFLLNALPSGNEFSLTDLPVTDDLGDDLGGGDRNAGMLLTSSRDPFTSAASYNFSSARFNARNLPGEYGVQYLNGVPMNDMNTGYNVWALWGGLNDVFRNQTNSTTFEPLEYGFGGLGVSNNVETRASSYGARRQVTYSASNRTYTNRAMLTYTTGLMKSGWAIAASASRRWGDGQSSYVRGTFYDATSLFLAVEKKLDAANSLAITALAAPTRRGVASASTQEAYDLAGSNFYNPNIGHQNGKWRNARVKDNFEPLVQLSHYFEPSSTFKLTTTFSFRGGWNKYSALNWYNAPDPRPDYYRNLPSYFTWMAPADKQDLLSAGYYEEAWRSERNVRYLDWDRLYQINRNNMETVVDQNGNTITGRRALYLIEDRHVDQTEWAWATRANWQALPWLKVDAGFNYRNNRTDNYSEVADLLGADYVYDIDKYAERDFGGDPDKLQIDLNKPNHVAYEGDRYSYDYRAYTDRYQGWFNLQYALGAVDAYTAFSLSYTNLYRRGLQRRGLFPEDSYGESKTLHYLDLGGKLGLTYRISGHHFLVLNAAAIEQAPTFRNAFISPRTRNTVADGLQSQLALSGDLSYQFRLPFLRGRLTAYYAQLFHGVQSLSFYDDSKAAFGNYFIKDIEERHMGIELGVEAKLSSTLEANAALALGQAQYANNPNYIQTIDNSNQIVDRDVIYWKGLNMANGPQTAATLGLTYRSPWYATFGVNANYYGRNFVSMNPAVRTDNARSQLDYKYIKPEKMAEGFTLDAYASYSWRIKSGVFLRFNLSVSNILNNRSLQSSGFEQLRIKTQLDNNRDTQLMRPFPTKYQYMYGTTFFFNTSLQF